MRFFFSWVYRLEKYRNVNFISVVLRDSQTAVSGFLLLDVVFGIVICYLIIQFMGSSLIVLQKQSNRLVHEFDDYVAGVNQIMREINQSVNAITELQLCNELISGSHVIYVCKRTGGIDKK